MRRHVTSPSGIAGRGRLGPLRQRMPSTGAEIAMLKSVWLPTGIRSGRSRLVTSTSTASCRIFPEYGASLGSTSDRNTSLPM